EPPAGARGARRARGRRRRARCGRRDAGRLAGDVHHPARGAARGGPGRKPAVSGKARGKPAPRPSWREAAAGTERASLLIGVVAAALSGSMWFLASADIDIWPLAYVAMVPALWVIDAAATRRRALLYGWVAGLVVNLGGFYWIIDLLTRHA